MELKIIPLMEDNLCGDGLIAEHGLSLYIETPKHKLLVDTGQSAKTWENAKVKGVDLTKVDTLFLSHGHYDHSGGLMAFAKSNPRAAKMPGESIIPMKAARKNISVLIRIFYICPIYTRFSKTW